MRLPGFVLAGVVTVSSLSFLSQPRAEFRLPYPVGDSARLIQGNNGPYGHVGHAEFAFDFVMPLRSAVVAARSGHVVAIEERFADGTRKPGEENFVVVQHNDSSFARYYHLTTNGVLVDVGRNVAAGDTIGLSGNSGASAGPHLHFDVTTGCFRWGCQTIAIRFANASADSMVTGRTIRALPLK